MIEFNLPLIATAIGIIVSIWKFANAISKFASSVNDLKTSMKESQDDRRDLRNVVNGHDRTLIKINTQYDHIREDLDEIKKKVS